MLRLMGIPKADKVQAAKVKKSGSGPVISSYGEIDWAKVRATKQFVIGFLNYRDLCAALAVWCAEPECTVTFDDTCSPTVKALLQNIGVGLKGGRGPFEATPVLNVFFQYLARDATIEQMVTTRIMRDHWARYAIDDIPSMARKELELQNQLARLSV